MGSAESGWREVRVVDGPAALAEAAAEAFRAIALDAAVARGRFAVALAGGSTPREAYRRLADPAWHAGALPWDRTEVFFGDERCVPPDHPRSNYRMAREALLDRVPLPPERVHRIEAERDPDDAARDYAAALRGVLGPSPRLDLVLLGLGPEGHTASLFPGSPALADAGLVAAPTVPQLGERRVTLTLAAINAAAWVVFVVQGEEKRQALGEVLTAGPDSPLPAARVRPVAGRVLFLASRDAMPTEH